MGNSNDGLLSEEDCQEIMRRMGAVMARQERPLGFIVVMVPIGREPGEASILTSLDMESAHGIIIQLADRIEDGEGSEVSYILPRPEN